MVRKTDRVSLFPTAFVGIMEVIRFLPSDTKGIPEGIESDG